MAKFLDRVESFLKNCENENMADKKKPPVNVPKKAGVQNGPKPITAPTRIKIISMGSGASGKSCLIKRYCEDRFVAKYIATIGVDYGVKPVQIDGIDVRVNFWDLSGHPEFFEIRNEFYKDAQGCILVYDICSLESYQECDTWLSEAAKFGANPREMPIILCANKVDKQKRVVSEEEGRQFAQSRGLSYFELSAQSGLNVNDMFEQLFAGVLRKTAISNNGG
mmetsp:Transcript_1445/g.1982  ORF Transcript_1445/g.1982 Transcript_1445/m.1982 type:complete len:222 (+) Transcript_1445:109-774(+)